MRAKICGMGIEAITNGELPAGEILMPNGELNPNVQSDHDIEQIEYQGIIEARGLVPKKDSQELNPMFNPEMPYTEPQD